MAMVQRLQSWSWAVCSDWSIHVAVSRLPD